MNQSICPKCNRDLEMIVEARVGGQVHVVFKCPKHGTLPEGWQKQLLYPRFQPTLYMGGPRGRS